MDDWSNVSISLEQTGTNGWSEEDGRGKGGRRVSMATRDPRHSFARPETRPSGTVELQGEARLCFCVCVCVCVYMLYVSEVKNIPNF